MFSSQFFQNMSTCKSFYVKIQENVSSLYLDISLCHCCFINPNINDKVSHIQSSHHKKLSVIWLASGKSHLLLYDRFCHFSWLNENQSNFVIRKFCQSVI